MVSIEVKKKILEKQEQLDKAREDAERIEGELADILSELHCKCDKLLKVISTNWSYYKCVDCGTEYFSPCTGKYAKVIWEWHQCPVCKERLYNKLTNSGTEHDVYVCRKCDTIYGTNQLKEIQDKYLRELGLIR